MGRTQGSRVLPWVPCAPSKKSVGWAKPAAGWGEAGSEHLLCWCPAVAEAWRLFRGSERSLKEAFRTPSAEDRALALLLHQASYLHHTLARRAVLTWTHVAHRIAARTRQGMLAPEDVDLSEASVESDDEPDRGGGRI